MTVILLAALVVVDFAALSFAVAAIAYRRRLLKLIDAAMKEQSQ